MKEVIELKSSDLIDGQQYVLDAEFNNSPIITLVWHGKYMCRVRSDEGNEWDTMCNRLSKIQPTSL